MDIEGTTMIFTAAAAQDCPAQSVPFTALLSPHAVRRARTGRTGGRAGARKLR